MKIERGASVVWTGAVRDGRGEITTDSGALDARPYGFRSRFEDGPGTNPEELLGAAHAACFTMALAARLTEEDLAPERLETRAFVTLARGEEGGFSIPAVRLELEARVPGLGEQRFQELAAAAKANCPVSRVLHASISLEATLVTAE